MLYRCSFSPCYRHQFYSVDDTTPQQPTSPIVAAVKDFRDTLDLSQQAEPLAIHGAKVSNAMAILAFTAGVDRTNERRKSQCVSSQLQGIYQSVQQFTSIVGTFVSSNQTIAALLWGSVRLTILAASTFSTFFEKLSGWFMKSQSLCPRIVEYQSLYPDSKWLQEALCIYYATVIRFCANTGHTQDREVHNHSGSVWGRTWNQVSTFVLGACHKSFNVWSYFRADALAVSN